MGSLAQARMRAGKGAVLRVRIKLDHLNGSIPKVRDQEGSWEKLLKRRRSRRQVIVEYLNRYEGLPVERVIAISEKETSALSTMSDRDFAKLVPEAEQSWVILDPGLIEVLGEEKSK